MHVLNYDDEIRAALTDEEKEALKLTRNGYGKLPFKEKHSPMNGWAVPFVTGHKYKFSFGSSGLDFDSLRLDLSERWNDDDKNIYFIHNFTDVRAAIDVKVNGVLFENDTLPSQDINDASLVMG